MRDLAADVVVVAVERLDVRKRAEQGAQREGAVCDLILLDRHLDLVATAAMFADQRREPLAKPAKFGENIDHRNRCTLRKWYLPTQLGTWVQCAACLAYVCRRSDCKNAIGSSSPTVVCTHASPASR